MEQYISINQDLIDHIFDVGRKINDKEYLLYKRFGFSLHLINYNYYQQKESFLD